jgi:diguanylate cyclase (GGDEF)-like protein
MIDSALAGAVLDAIPDATAVLDQAGTIIGVNHAWRMFALDNGGTPVATGAGVNYFRVCERAQRHGCAEAGDVADQLRSVLNDERVEAEVQYPCPSPAVGRWFVLRISKLRGATPGAVVSHVNITRRMMAEQELAHAASHDPLSGLANRTLFRSRLKRALRATDGRQRIGDAGVLYLDLDGFKAINDTFGHAAGDEVLLAVAHRLRNTVRPGDTIARLGGDEFAVLAPRVDHDGLAALAARIKTSLDQPHSVHATQVLAGASIGTHLTHAGEDMEQALQKADHSMYADKTQRKAGR